jgi:hypothetical protein
LAKQGTLLPEAGAAILAYLVATAAVGGRGGAFRAPLPSYVVWIVCTLGLFSYLIRVCVRRGAFRSFLLGLLAITGTTAATAVVELTRFRRQSRYAATVAAACCCSKSIGLT